jgi:hypothetical protein
VAEQSKEGTASTPDVSPGWKRHPAASELHDRLAVLLLLLLPLPPLLLLLLPPLLLALLPLLLLPM